MKNYTNYQKLKKELFNIMDEFPDVEFDIMIDYDDNKQKYLYVHLKDYSDGYQWNKARKYLTSALRKYDRVFIDGNRKVLYWIPEERDLSCLVINDELYKILERDLRPVIFSHNVKPKQSRLLAKIKLENTNYGHYKEWRAELYKNGTVITQWGRIGDNLTSKKFPNAGKEFFNKKVREKLNKGYVPA